MTESAETRNKVVIGTPIDSGHAYVLDKFLENLKLIQQEYPASELVLATSEKDYALKLKGILRSAHVQGTVLVHTPQKPDYARHWIWDVTSGREAIRRYAASQTGADYLFFLDGDTLCQPDIIARLLKHIDGCDAVFNGCALRQGGTGLAGAGCLMLSRRAFEGVNFRCCEFPSGEVIFEDNMLEMDLFRLGARIKKGIYAPTDHYQDARSFQRVEAQPVGKIRTLVNHPFIRYVLIKASVALRYNFPWRLKLFLDRLRRGAKKGH